LFSPPEISKICQYSRWIRNAGKLQNTYVYIIIYYAASRYYCYCYYYSHYCTVHGCCLLLFSRLTLYILVFVYLPQTGLLQYNGNRYKGSAVVIRDGFFCGNMRFQLTLQENRLSGKRCNPHRPTYYSILLDGSYMW